MRNRNSKLAGLLFRRNILSFWLICVLLGPNFSVTFCAEGSVEEKEVNPPCGSRIPAIYRVKIAILKGELEIPTISYFTIPGFQPPVLPSIDCDVHPSVLVVLWRNGKVIWSKDLFRGGPPYFEGFVQKEAIENLISQLDRKGYFKQTSLRRVYSGIDAKSSQLVVTTGTNVLSMESWHELAECKPNIIATSHGLECLEGRTREEVRAKEEDKDYILFRQVWDEVRSGILDLIPKEGGKLIVAPQFEIRWTKCGETISSEIE